MCGMSIAHAPHLSSLSRRGLFGLTADPRGPLDDLHGCAPGHRTARFLVEELGARTIAWEESWGSGVVLDRYVRGDGTDARTAVGQARVALRGQAMLDLVRWMREFNRGRPGWDQVRFLGAGVLEPRSLQYAELHRFVAEVAPARLRRAGELLMTLAMRGTPQVHRSWYTDVLSEAERQPLVAAARELDALVREVADSRAARRRRCAVDPDDAVLHAFALLGFHECGSAAGGHLRDRYATGIVTAWRERTGHEVVRSADVAPSAFV